MKNQEAIQSAVNQLLSQVLEEFGGEPSAGGSVSSGSGAGGAVGQAGIEPKSRDYQQRPQETNSLTQAYGSRIKPLIYDQRVAEWPVEEIAKLVEAIYDQRGADIQLSGKAKQFVMDTLPLTKEEEGPRGESARQKATALLSQLLETTKS